MSFLFDYHMSYQTDCANATKLPFQLFGMSQQGSSHSHVSMGNQDSAGVFIGKSILVGVVADGCSGGKNINGFSFNHVGAHIACNLTVKIVRRLLQRKSLSLEVFKKEYEQSLFKQYRRLFNSFSPWKNERELTLSNLFSSTFLVFVITSTHYIVFHYGDGHIFINKKHYDLSSMEGEYFSNKLLKNSNNIKPHGMSKIRFVETGLVDDLDNILIATDGFIDNNIKNTSHFHNFFFRDKPLFNQVGFDDRKTDFRTNVLEGITLKDSYHDWPQDDATFISLRRVPKFKFNRI